MRLHKENWLAIIAIGFAFQAATAWGQGVRLTQATYMGEIVGVQGHDVLVKANNGASVFASLDPERRIGNARVQDIGVPKIEVVGEIRGDQLTKGMYVRFVAKVQGGTRRRTVEPVKKIEVFTPNAQTQFGLLDEAVVGAGEGADEDAEPIKQYRVVGVVTSLRTGTMGVEFPGGRTKGSLSAKLAEDAVANVKLNQLITPPGAQITVEGVQVLGATSPVKLLVTSMQIQLPPPAPPGPKVARRPPGRKNGDDKEPAENDAVAAFAGAGGGNDTPPGEKKLVPGKILKVN